MTSSSRPLSIVETDDAPELPAHPNWHPQPYSVPRELAGSATVTPSGPVVAGSWGSFEIVYAAGRFGVDDSGSIKVCFRFATDQTRLQFDDPKAPGFVSVAASNDAYLEARFDYKQNTRPYDRTLHIKVVRGFLKEGDTITVRIGDRSQGSPGLRVQTFSESHFAFRVLADPIACYQFVPVLDQPMIEIAPGERASWIAVLPTVAAVGRPFRLRIRSEDQWGNPSGVGKVALRLRGPAELAGLPATLDLDEGAMTAEIAGLSAKAAGTVTVEILDEAGEALCVSNPCVVTETEERSVYWADFHAQSAETIGTNSAVEYFDFARDVAFLDIVGHQGNDFQITQQFWSDLNRLYAEYDDEGRFVTMPGYEWSGNTPLGGDRNVFFYEEGRRIRRSSHALVPDHSDIESDCHTARDLFAALGRDGENAIMFAHVGGRYADIAVAHDPAIETAVEMHSSWGTFEWIVNDAFDLGYRVGIVANSDGHKGRPGAEAPGASMFGSYGGLTALRLDGLSRANVFEALRARSHYATTGSRMLLDLLIKTDADGMAFEKDPVLGRSGSRMGNTFQMGEIVHAPGAGEAVVEVAVTAPAPIERIEFRRGREIVGVHRPYSQADLGRRIRVVWSGAEYRGRFRMTAWDGDATLEGNGFESARPINFMNKDRKLEAEGDRKLSWKSITTGNFSGFDAMLKDAAAGVLKLRTPLAEVEVRIDEIGLEPIVFELGGLDRKLTVQRLPDVNRNDEVRASCAVALQADKDNPVYVNVVTEDGHQAWTSPVYFVPKPDWL